MYLKVIQILYFVMNDSNCKTYLNDVDSLPTTINTSVAVVYLLMAVTTIAVNLLLIAAMISTKQAFTNTSSKIIMFMSFADTLNGALSFPLLAAVRLWYYKDCVVKTASEFAMTFLGYLSSMAIILLAVDRYLHIQATVPVRESFIRKLFKGRRLVIPLLSITLFSISMSILFWLFSNTGYAGKFSIGVVVIILKITSICTITIFYLKGYKKVQRFVKTNPIYNRGIENVDLSVANRHNTRSESTRKEPGYLRNLYKTVALLVATLMVTYIPHFVTQSTRVILLLMGKHCEGLLIATEVLNLLLLLNSITNSFIIFKMNKKARSWVLKKFCCVQIPHRQSLN